MIIDKDLKIIRGGSGESPLMQNLLKHPTEVIWYMVCEYHIQILFVY